MEYGLPVVSTNEGGIPDIVVDGETGYTVEKRNPETLADAIEKLILNPQLMLQMGKAGRKRFEEKFTELQFEKTMLGCLKCSLKSKGQVH